MKERDEIEELFSSAFSDFEKMPPIDVKAAIDERIQAALPSKRRKGGFIWIMSSIIGLVLLSWIGIRIFSSDQVKERGNQQQFISKQTTDQETEANSGLGNVSSDNELNDSEQGSQKNSIDSDEKSLQNTTSTNSTSTNKELGSTYPVKPTKQLLPKKRTSHKGSDVTFVSNDRSPKKGNTGKIVKKNDQTDKSLENVVITEDIAKTIEKGEVTDKNVTKNPIVSEEVLANSSEQPSDSPNEISPEVAVNPLPQTVPETATFTPWSYTLYAGTTYGFSSLKQGVGSEYLMKEKFGISASFESNYQINSRFGIAAGLDFNSRKDVFYQKVNEAVDSSFTGNTLQYIYDPQVVDSIIDSMMVATYSYSFKQIEHQEIINHYSIAIPVYFNVNVFTAGKWSMKVNAGMRFSYVSNKLGSNPYNLPNPEFKSFGLRGSLRPQILYTADNGFGIGGYVNAGYDLIPTVQWSEITRDRIDLGVGLLFRFSF